MKRKHIFLSLFFAIGITTSSVIPPIAILLNTNNINVNSKYIQEGFDDFHNQQINISNDFNLNYKIDENKYNLINDVDINNIIFDFYNNFYNKKHKNTNNNAFLEMNSDIDINYKIDSYIKKQTKRFVKKPSANINLKYKKCRMVSNDNWSFKFLNFVEWVKNNKQNLNTNFNYNIDINIIKKLYNFLINNTEKIEILTFLNILNNNFKNLYEIRINEFSIHMDKKYVGNAIFVPMYAKEFDWTINPLIINTIDISYIISLIKDPIEKLFKSLNEKNKNIIIKTFHLFSYIKTLSPMLNYKILLPMIRIKDMNELKISSLNFGNFKLYELLSNENSLYINSNNTSPTYLNFEKSVCNGALCSHNIYGFNRIFAELIKWAFSILSQKDFYKIASIIIRLILPVLSSVALALPGVGIILTTLSILLNLSLNFIEEIYKNFEKKYIAIFNKYFDVNNFSFRDIFDMLFRSIITSLNENVYALARKYAGILPYHGLDVAKCSTALVNLKIDTKSKKNSC